MNEKDFFDYLSSFTNAEQCLSSFSNQKQFFRLNTLKVSLENFKEFSKLSYLPTKYEFAFELSESLEIGKTWEYFLGYIYPQSLPSIIDSIVLNPNKDDVVLDVAASPGSGRLRLGRLQGCGESRYRVGPPGCRCHTGQPGNCRGVRCCWRAMTAGRPTLRRLAKMTY